MSASSDSRDREEKGGSQIQVADPIKDAWGILLRMLYIVIDEGWSMAVSV